MAKKSLKVKQKAVSDKQPHPDAKQYYAEYGVKSGRLNQEGALEAVMLKLLSLRESR